MRALHRSCALVMVAASAVAGGCTNFEDPTAVIDLRMLAVVVQASEVILDVDDGMKSRCAVNLHNAVTITQERVGNRVASLSAGRLREVCSALQFALGSNKR